MVSPNKTRDRDNRTMIMETMQIALRLGNIDMARKFGEHSQALKEKIATYDYAEDDAEYERVSKIINLVKKHD